MIKFPFLYPKSNIGTHQYKLVQTQLIFEIVHCLAGNTVQYDVITFMHA